MATGFCAKSVVASWVMESHKVERLQGTKLNTRSNAPTNVTRNKVETTLDLSHWTTFAHHSRRKMLDVATC
jgi:hypothetical protein